MQTAQRTVARIEMKTHLGPSTRTEIAQAVRDFHEGKVDGIPCRARLQYR